MNLGFDDWKSSPHPLSPLIFGADPPPGFFPHFGILFFWMAPLNIMESLISKRAWSDLRPIPITWCKYQILVASVKTCSHCHILDASLTASHNQDALCPYRDQFVAPYFCLSFYLSNTSGDKVTNLSDSREGNDSLDLFWTGDSSSITSQRSCFFVVS